MQFFYTVPSLVSSTVKFTWNKWLWGEWVILKKKSQKKQNINPKEMRKGLNDSDRVLHYVPAYCRFIYATEKLDASFIH